MSIGPSNIIDKKEKYLIPCSNHFYKKPPQIVKGDMQYLFDSDGKKYIDFFAGVSVMNCGHCNKIILSKTIAQMKELQHTTTIYLNEPIVNLAEKFSDFLPGDINKSFFCMSGSEANEGAMLLSKLHTKKENFIYFENSLHGRTHLTMSVTGIEMWRTSPIFSENNFKAKSFYPDVYMDGYWQMSDEEIEILKEESANSSLENVANILENNDNIAAIIVEPIQGNGGILVPHKDFFKKLYDLAHRHGALLIVDEVQTGFARTGKNFAIEHFNVTPDIITTAKGLGNGVPIAAFSTTDSIASSFTSPSASTLGGNPVSSINSIAVLDYIIENDLSRRSKDLGIYLLEKLKELKIEYPIIRDIRGKGLMIGLEIVNPNNTPAPELVDEILELMKDQNVILGKNGVNRNVLAFQPPLVINYEDIDYSIECLRKILKSIIN